MVKDSHFIIGLVVLTGIALTGLAVVILGIYFLSSPANGPGDPDDWPTDWFREDGVNGGSADGWDDSWMDDSPYSGTEGDASSQNSAEEYLSGCEPMEEERVMGENIDITVLYRIEGERNGYCIVYEKVLSDNEGFGLSGKDMTCRIPISRARDLSLDGMECEGPLSDAIDGMNGGEGI